MLEFYTILIFLNEFENFEAGFLCEIPDRSKLFNALAFKNLKSYNFTFPSLLPIVTTDDLIASFWKS